MIVSNTTGLHGVEKLVDCHVKLIKGEINVDTCFEKEKQILTDEIDDPEFLNYPLRGAGMMYVPFSIHFLELELVLTSVDKAVTYLSKEIKRKYL